MRVEQHNGRYILCGAILPTQFIKKDQVWQDSAGHTVTVRHVTEDTVDYMSNSGWAEYLLGRRELRQLVLHKSPFDFQCRYCLVLDSNEIPADIQAAFKERSHGTNRPGPGLGHQQD